MTLIAELKRRKVFKVGAAYLVVGWLLIQVAATIAPQLNLPEWSPRLITFVILLGFPIAILLAWVLDVTPDGIKLDAAPIGNKRIIVIVATLLALSIGWYWQEHRAPDAIGAGKPSIAVLPFANLSGKSDEEYFSDGMTEELLNVLAKVPQLEVAARTSVFAFKNKGGDVREIGRQLGVNHILEGSIRRDGQEVRVTAQLIRVSDGFHVWSETYDRKLESVFALQDEIARKVGEQLVTSLIGSKPTAARGDIDPVAYDEYLKGRALHRARSHIPTAIFHFQNAVRRAPQFAAAWANLALSYDVTYGRVDPIEQIALGDRLAHMREAAARAEALAPDAAPALHALANVARLEHRYADAEALYVRSVAADPGYADVRKDYGEFLQQMGRNEDALRADRELFDREPRVPVFLHRLLWLGVETDRKDLVHEFSRKVLAIDPYDEEAITAPYLLEFNQGRIESAGQAIEALHASQPEMSAHEWVLFHWSQHAPAIDDATARRQIEQNSYYAKYAAARGEPDLYFDSLSSPESTEHHFNDSDLYESLSESLVRGLLSDPRAKQLLRDAGFEKYWRVKGWPALCRPKGDTDFECGDFKAKENPPRAISPN